MKSVAVYNLKLPKDVLEIICSFNFYTLNECIKNVKNKYKNVIKEINYIERFQYYGIQCYTGIYYHIQISMMSTQSKSVEDLYKELNLCICIYCNEFIKNTNTRYLCQCYKPNYANKYKTN